MSSLIAAAIEQRRLLKLTYTAGSRIVEPHVYGLDGKSRELLRCYQIAGESTSRERAGWKLLRADDATAVEVLDVRFVPRAGYNQSDPAIIDPALIVLTTRRSGTAGAGRWSGSDGAAWIGCACG
jgi:hypothetical protein